jgi:uncharacterized membrane protein YedE/YeeE
MRELTAFLAGGLFGAGLLVSGMTDTRRVLGFLDLFGAWDPTLAFVMGGAILPMAVAWRIAGRGAYPQVREGALAPDLVSGSILFGIGWGLAGLCPGPAMASVTFGGLGGVVFLLAMAAGMLVQPTLRRRLWPVVGTA